MSDGQIILMVGGVLLWAIGVACGLFFGRILIRIADSPEGREMQKRLDQVREQREKLKGGQN